MAQKARRAEAPQVQPAVLDQLPHHLVSHWLYGHQLAIPIPDVDHTRYMLILGRIYMEVLIVLFKIAENLGDINRKTKD